MSHSPDINFMRVAHSRQSAPVERWLNRWWPSSRLRRDPMSGVRVEGRYVPVSIANWKLTPWMARDLLRRRVSRPLTFSAVERLTVIIPYRDRAEHLQRFAPALSAALRKQAVSHRILVVEQEPGRLFNRGKLVNIGFDYAAADTDYYCVHDVDALPMVADYRCPSQPLRLVTKLHRIDGRIERTPHYFSGAISIRKEQVFAAGGFSNEYWGWGKEDDDFFFRLLLAGYFCYYDSEGEFRDLPNPSHQLVAPANSVTPAHVRRNRRLRSLLVRGQVHPEQDGLRTLRYELLSETMENGYERIVVRV